MVLSDGRAFPPRDNEIAILVDSGATAHFVDSELLPELKEKIITYPVLNTPNE